MPSAAQEFCQTDNVASQVPICLATGHSTTLANERQQEPAPLANFDVSVQLAAHKTAVGQWPQ